MRDLLDLCIGAVFVRRGRTVKSSVSTMLEDTPAESSMTCRLMYTKKASELHLPCNMMSTTGVPLRYMANAAPHLTECVPKSAPDSESLSDRSMSMG